jgi:non-canonical (house-cleaning) NTP pyrophosphatase
MGDKETREGARNRALNAAAAFKAAAAAVGGALAAAAPDFALGLEGGCGEEYGELVCFAWVCVVSKCGRESFARTASFALPREVAQLVRGGMELGLADDAVFKREGSKHHDGAVGLLTKGAISRTKYYAHAVTMAIIPFINSDLCWG